MPYDYTRVQVGDRVRDNQTLQEGHIFDVQMVGQWGAVITVAWLVSGMRREIPCTVRSAPAGVTPPTPSEISTASVRPLAAGESVEVTIDAATSGISLDVVGRASATATAQLTPDAIRKSADWESEEVGLSRLRAYLSQNYKGKRKAEIVELVEALESAERDKGLPHGTVATKISRLLNTSSQSELSRQQAVRSYVRSLVPGAPADLTRALAETTHRAERRYRVLSNVGPRAAQPRNPFYSPFAEQVGSSPAYTQTVDYLIDGVQRDSAFELEEKLSGTIRHIGPEEFENGLIPGLKLRIQGLRDDISRVHQIESSVRRVSRLWPAARLDGRDEVIAGVRATLDNARFFGIIGKNEGGDILRAIEEAFSSGRAVRFYDAQRRLRAIQGNLDRLGLARNLHSRLESAYVVRDAVRQQLFDPGAFGLAQDLFDSALDVQGMASSAADRQAEAEFFHGLDAIARYSREDAAAAMHERTLLGARANNARFARRAREYDLVNTAIASKRRSLDYNERMSLEWRGQRLDITSIFPDERTGQVRVGARTSASRVLDEGDFFLVTRLKADGDAYGSLVGALAGGIEAELLDQEGESVLLDDYSREAAQALRAPLRYSAEGGAYVDEVLRHHFPAEAVPTEGLRRKLRQLMALSNRDAADLEERMADAMDAYARVVSGKTGGAYASAHNKGLAAATEVLNRPSMSRLRDLSIDALTHSPDVEAEVSQRAAKWASLEDPAHGFLRSVRTPEGKRLAVLRGLGLSPELAAATVEGNIDGMKVLGLQALGLDQDTAALLLRDDLSVKQVNRELAGIRLRSLGVDDALVKTIMSGGIDLSISKYGQEAIHAVRLAHMDTLDIAMRYGKQAAAVYEAETIEEILPTLAKGAKLAKIHKLLADDDYLESVFSKQLSKSARAIAESRAKRMLAGVDVIGSRTSAGTIGEQVDPQIRDALARLAGGATTDEVAGDLVMLRLSRDQIASMLNPVGDTADELLAALRRFGIDLPGTWHAGGLSGAGTQVMYRRAQEQPLHALMAGGGSGSLTDAMGQVFRLAAEDEDVILPAESLLNRYSGGVADTSQIELERLLANHRVGSNLYALPGGAAWQNKFISTFEGADAFRSHMLAMRDAVQGRLDSLYVLDIETEATEQWAAARLGHPVTLDQVAVVNARRVVDADGTVRYVKTGSPIHLAGGDERSMISSIVDLVNNAGNAALVTHNKQHDLPALVARARALGMDHEAGVLEAVYLGRHSVKNIDSQVLTQLAYPSEWSHSVQAAAIYSGARPPGWVQPHAKNPVADAEVELDILNRASARARSTVEWLASPENLNPTDVTGQLVWRASGPAHERRRLYQIQGIAQDETMATEHKSVMIMREMFLDESGNLRQGRLHGEDAADFYLWRKFGGNYVRVENVEQGRKLVSDTEEDLARGRIRSVFTDINRPFAEMDRIRAFTEAGASLERPSLSPEVADALVSFIQSGAGREKLPLSVQNDIARYGRESMLAEWMLSWGSDTRIQGQMRRMADWMQNEFEPVHRGFYEWARNLDIEDKYKNRLLGMYWGRVNPVLGEFAEGAVDIPQFARQLSVHVPFAGKSAFGFDIGSEEQLRWSISHNADRIATYLSAERAQEILAPHASQSEIAGFINAFGRSDRVSTLTNQGAVDALRQGIWSNEIFGAFTSSRSELARDLTDQLGADALADAMSSPEALFRRLVEVGSLENLEAWQVRMLTMRDITDYLVPRTTGGALTDEQRTQLDAIAGDIKTNWEKMIGGDDDAARAAQVVLPHDDFIYSRYRGKTVAEAYRVDLAIAMRDATSAQEAAKRARGRTSRFLAHTLAYHDYFAAAGEGQVLGTEVRSQILDALGLAGASEAKLAAFNRGVIGQADPTELYRSGELSADAAQVLRPHVREAAEQRIAAARSLGDLAGAVNPLNVDQDLPTGMPELAQIAANERLGEPAGENILSMLESARASTAGGFRSASWADEGFSQALEHTLGATSKHDSARAAIETAEGFLHAIKTVPMAKVAVGAIGTAAALFLARKPNLEQPEERMTPRQSFEAQVSAAEEPVYHRIYARVKAFVDPESGVSDEDIISATSQAAQAHLGSDVRHSSHSSTDSRAPFTRRVIEDLTGRVMNALAPKGP